MMDIIATIAMAAIAMLMATATLLLASIRRSHVASISAIMGLNHTYELAFRSVMLEMNKLEERVKALEERHAADA